MEPLESKCPINNLLHKKPLPQNTISEVRRHASKTENKFPLILEISSLHKSCSKQKCKSKGAEHNFILHFKYQECPSGSHNMKIGLRGGNLVISQSPLCAREYIPKRIIRTNVPVKVSKAIKRGAELGLEPKLIEGIEKNVGTEFDHCVTTWLGDISCPKCKFEAFDDTILNGFIEDVGYTQSPHDKCNCYCLYSFEVSRSNWLCTYHIHPSTSGLKRLFSSLKLKHKAKRIEQDCFEYVKITFNNVLSKWSWSCSCKK